jgi:CheY-like chemotaxis protein
MDELIGPVWAFVSSHLGLKETLLLIVAAVALYGWHLFLRAQHLREANEHERRRSQQAYEDLERLKQASPGTASPGDRRQSDATGRRAERSVSRVLVVEDDQIMQTIIPVMLSRCLSSVDVRVQETTQQAKDEIKRFRPDLLVLDLRLKMERGLDLLEHMRALDAQLPVLVYSGYDDEIDRLRIARDAAGLQNVTILQKGSDLDVFMRVVPTLFRRRSADRAPAAATPSAPSRERRGAVDRRLPRSLAAIPPQERRKPPPASTGARPTLRPRVAAR